MNTTALKSFAPTVRRQLMEAVSRKLDVVLAAQTPDYLTTYAPQVAALRKQAEADRAGLVERVAYTWFNRFTALRYLDAKGWHPFRCRVLTAASPEETQPEILKLTRTGALPEELNRHTNPQRLNDLLDGNIPSPDPQGEVYRHLVLAACRFYHSLLPDLFERLDDATELLLPDDLLTEHAIVQGFHTEITDEDCAEVEILGWLYQFYISEKKDTVMARKSAVPTEDIPAVTQLFTPHWIVRYLVENSLGRLWLLNRPKSALREKMPYYIEGEAETDFLKISKPEEIRVLDPAVGSGHMLTYAFDLLYAIYEEEGYAPSDIPGLILTHNLHGIDICPRAAQIAALALVLKAREKSRRFLQSDKLVQPHILAMQDVHFGDGELIEYVRALNLDDLFDAQVLQLLHQFKDATTLGSLIQPCLDEASIALVRSAIEAKDLGGRLFLSEAHRKVLLILEQADALSLQYGVVVANPPYMGGRINPVLGNFLGRQFPSSRTDLSAVFIERSREFCADDGILSLVTMHSWMFLDSLEGFRKNLLSESTIVAIAHFGIGAFPTLNSKVVQTAAVVVKCRVPTSTHIPICDRLLDYNPIVKERQLIGGLNRFRRLTQSSFFEISGCPVTYWLSTKSIDVFRGGRKFIDIGEIKSGIMTGNDPEFIRRWHEVSYESIGLGHRSAGDIILQGKRWFPINRGGDERRWHGNNLFLINMEGNGRNIRKYGRGLNFRLRDDKYYFREGITWGRIGNGRLSARHSPTGFLFGDAGTTAYFSSESDLYFALGVLSSNSSSKFLEALSPTMNFQVYHIEALPIPRISVNNMQIYDDINENVVLAIEIARHDWNNFETSWDFGDQPLLRPKVKGETLEVSWNNWTDHCEVATNRMRELETANNSALIAEYGLQDELGPDVPIKEITLAGNPAFRYKRKAKKKSDLVDFEELTVAVVPEDQVYTEQELKKFQRSDTIKEFVSYSIGCMMGRYSLDKPSLILADAGDSLEEYVAKVGKPLDQLTFVPDEDGIIPVLDGEWFEDDVVARVREFLRATYGEDTLRENIRFIEESLGKDLRKYFLSDFYKDHLQTYKKRPIYWMVQSPKKGFQALIYLHRYTKDTMNLVLNKYLREYQVKLRSRIAHLADVQIDASATAAQKTAARKESDKLTKTLHECEEWERQVLLPLAQARIELDLDDGVKVNYLKLGEALAPIPGLAAKDDE